MHQESEQKRHKLFYLALERNGSRVFSTFRTNSNIRIDIWPHLERPNPYIAITLGDIQYVRESALVYRKELFDMYSDGGCTIRPEATIDNISGFGRPTMEGMGGFRENKYTYEDIFDEKRSFYDGHWHPAPIKAVLDQISAWIEDPMTVRVDPYNFDRILPEENTDYDEELSRNVQYVEETVRSIQLGEFTINPPGD